MIRIRQLVGGPLATVLAARLSQLPTPATVCRYCGEPLEPRNATVFCNDTCAQDFDRTVGPPTIDLPTEVGYDE